jgi:hypothetical protein
MRLLEIGDGEDDLLESDMKYICTGAAHRQCIRQYDFPVSDL